MERNGNLTPFSRRTLECSPSISSSRSPCTGSIRSWISSELDAFLDRSGPEPCSGFAIALTSADGVQLVPSRLRWNDEAAAHGKEGGGGARATATDDGGWRPEGRMEERRGREGEGKTLEGRLQNE
jgi:hypothetical protein